MITIGGGVGFYLKKKLYVACFCCKTCFVPFTLEKNCMLSNRTIFFSIGVKIVWFVNGKKCCTDKRFFEKYVCFALLHEKFLRRRNTEKKSLSQGLKT